MVDCCINIDMVTIVITDAVTVIIHAVTITIVNVVAGTILIESCCFCHLYLLQLLMQFQLPLQLSCVVAAAACTMMVCYCNWVLLFLHADEWSVVNTVVISMTIKWCCVVVPVGTAIVNAITIAIFFAVSIMIAMVIALMWYLLVVGSCSGLCMLWWMYKVFQTLIILFSTR